jgi:hypothetical protein
MVTAAGFFLAEQLDAAAARMTISSRPLTTDEGQRDRCIITKTPTIRPFKGARARYLHTCGRSSDSSGIDQKYTRLDGSMVSLGWFNGESWMVQW